MFKDIFPVRIYETEFPDFHTIQQSMIDDINEKFNDLLYEIIKLFYLN